MPLDEANSQPITPKEQLFGLSVEFRRLSSAQKFTREQHEAWANLFASAIRSAMLYAGQIAGEEAVRCFSRTRFNPPGDL